MTLLMAPSLSLKSFSLALAALGFTGVAPPGGGARVAPLPAVVPMPTTPMIGAIDPVTVKRASDGLFYITADVNGVPVRFVVDTGANVVVLTRADAAAAGVAGNRRSARTLQTAGGGSVMRWATIERLTIGDRAIASTDAAIVGDGGLPHSLLGQSVLSRLDSVTLRGNRLELR